MANKFLSDINLTARLQANGQSGSSGQILSSTGTGVEWINQSSIEVSSNLVYFDVKNETGSTISKGKGVMAVGTDGNSGHILIDEMVGDGTIEPKYFLGVLEEDIANGQNARVISFGMISQFDTRGQNGETWADGNILWCDPVNAGDFTITEPDGPNVKIAAAIILNSSTNGKIQVRVQANEGIHDLHDTKITSQVDGDVLVWDNTTGVWFNDSTLNVDYTNSRVGIGTTSPSRKLVVAGAADGIIQSIDTTGAGSHIRMLADVTAQNTINWNKDTSLRFTTSDEDWANYSEKMRITSTGNVGIGTTGPNAKLEVKTSSYNAGNAIANFVNGNDPTRVSYDTVVIAQTDVPTLSIVETIDGSQANEQKLTFSVGDNKAVIASTSTATNGMYFNVNRDVDVPGYNTGNGITALKISNNGNIGIGTTSPTNGKLVIDSTGNQIAIETGTAGDGRLNIGHFSNGTFIGTYGDDGGAADLIRFGTHSGDERMRINSSGNVGIGTTSPSQKLDVNGNAYISGQAQASTAVIKTYSGHAMFGSNSTAEPIALGRDAANLDLVVATNGNVGIGTTSPSQKLHVNGSAIFSPVGSTTPTLDLVSYNGSSDPFTRYYDESNGPSWCTGLDVSDEKYKISFDYDNTSISTSTKLTIDTAGKVGIGTIDPQSKLDVAGGIRIANDSAAASASNVGTLRYRTSGNNSYVDMCMQTGASTYAWVNIVQNNW